MEEPRRGGRLRIGRPSGASIMLDSSVQGLAPLAIDGRPSGAETNSGLPRPGELFEDVPHRGFGGGGMRLAVAAGRQLHLKQPLARLAVKRELLPERRV